MNTKLVLKLGQIGGALMLAGGVTACQMQEHTAMPMLFFSGAVVYGSSRMIAWLMKD